MDYTQFAGPILTLLGGFLIWLRQFKWFSDWMIAVTAFALSGATYGTVHLFTADWRLELLSGVLQIATYTAACLGGTAVAARVAATGIAGLPQANTKG